MRKTCQHTIYELAKENPRIFYIGSDLGIGTLQEFKDEMPDRFFMEGISEANVIGMAAGLALGLAVCFLSLLYAGQGTACRSVVEPARAEALAG